MAEGLLDGRKGWRDRVVLIPVPAPPRRAALQGAAAAYFSGGQVRLLVNLFMQPCYLLERLCTGVQSCVRPNC